MDKICVILPSRGRPVSLERAVSSLTAGKDAQVEVIVGLDEDDISDKPVSLLEKLPGVRVFVNPRQRTVGTLFNLMHKHSDADWFIPFPDDYTMDDTDWADKLRAAVTRMPCSLGVAYLKDLLYPDFTTFPIVHRKSIEMNGFFMPEFFPFLFGDTWWNEVGVMCGIRQPVDTVVRIHMDHGNEHMTKDMVTWATLFEKTRPMRMQTAIKIIQSIYDHDEAGAAFLLSTMQSRADICEQYQKFMFGQEFLDKFDNRDKRPASNRYLALKSKAEAFNLMQF